ncbi:TrbM/KikA/MpfK family conjugal transfer protein [uncultured Pigmentiphaga sp.]|uniref:TrbM/KikA/MpfK family conjugal transfer protein n=1 Tax=uncultured Pigmentiphaga sp. TaxID=340361 RepID=UPI002620ECD2|nr:TrbM/KikA/MpfK family conjugal transfer protein [uncultured Pigmentiphaga sp.]
MRTFIRIVLIASAILASTAQADEVLTGTPRLACEALLCLSSSTRPGECGPALSRYFGIHKRKLSDTLDARQAFLNQCPTVAASGEMRDLARAIARGAGRCDAQSLNRVLMRYMTDSNGNERRVVADRMPNYCSVYSGHLYTDVAGAMPRYVGTPDEEGYWVPADDYEAELVKYQEALAARKEAERRRREYESGGN